MNMDAEKAIPDLRALLAFPVASIVVMRIIRTANSHGLMASTRLPIITAIKVRLNF
jgi:hypothetical protein